MPRFTYSVKGGVADLLQSDAQTFNAFAERVQADLRSVLEHYDVEDKSTKRTLLDAELSLEELAGNSASGPGHEQTFGRRFGIALNPLPWDIGP